MNNNNTESEIEETSYYKEFKEFFNLQNDIKELNFYISDYYLDFFKPKYLSKDFICNGVSTPEIKTVGMEDPLEIPRKCGKLNVNIVTDVNVQNKLKDINNTLANLANNEALKNVEHPDLFITNKDDFISKYNKFFKYLNKIRKIKTRELANRINYLLETEVRNDWDDYSIEPESQFGSKPFTFVSYDSQKTTNTIYYQRMILAKERLLKNFFNVHP
jgi:hypothetical protein